MDRLLTVRDLAERLRVTPTCVYRWLAENRFPAIRLSRRCVRFRETDVEEILRRLAQGRAPHTVDALGIAKARDGQKHLERER